MILLWLDLETTGLDPKTDEVLELSVGVATIEDPFRVGPMRSWVFPWKGDPESLPSHVREMHTANGLLKECASEPCHRPDLVRDVDARLRALVPSPDTVEYDERAVLAGSSVHFDLGFLRAQFPVFASYLSHRLYDVSAVKLFCESLGMPKMRRGEAHRAHADVVESVKHAAACQDWLVGPRRREVAFQAGGRAHRLF